METGAGMTAGFHGFIRNPYNGYDKRRGTAMPCPIGIKLSAAGISEQELVGIGFAPTRVHSAAGA